MMYFLYGILNLSWVALCVYAWMRFPSKKHSIAFTVLVLSVLLYGNSVISIVYAGPEVYSSNTLDVFGRMVFGAGYLWMISTNYFVLLLARPDFLKKKSIQLVQIHNVIVATISFMSPLVIQSVEQDETGTMMPVPGPLVTYYVISLILNSIFILTVFFLQWVRSTDRLIRYQLRWVFISTLIGLVGILVTNIIYPQITGRHNLSGAGPLWALVPAMGITWVIMNAKKAVINASIPQGMEDFFMQLLDGINAMLTGTTGKFTLRFNEEFLSIARKKADTMSLEECIESNTVPGFIVNSLLEENAVLRRETIADALWRENIQNFCMEKNLEIPVSRPNMRVSEKNDFPDSALNIISELNKRVEQQQKAIVFLSTRGPLNWDTQKTKIADRLALPGDLFDDLVKMLFAVKHVADSWTYDEIFRACAVDRASIDRLISEGLIQKKGENEYIFDRAAVALVILALRGDS